MTVEPEQVESAAERLDLETVPDSEAQAAAEEEYERNVRDNVPVNEEMLLNESRRRLYAKLGELGTRDLLTVYVRGLSLEEARLNLQLKKKGGDRGVRDLRQKAARAIRGERIGEDEDDGDST